MSAGKIWRYCDESEIKRISFNAKDIFDIVDNRIFAFGIDVTYICRVALKGVIAP